MYSPSWSSSGRMVRGLLPILAAVLLAAAAGCAGRACYRAPDEPVGNDAVHVPGVVAFEQAEGRCGPAALASMLTWSGLDIRPADLEEMTWDPGAGGSLQASLVGAARRHGRIAYEIHGMERLEEELSAGFPALVLLNQGLSWWPAYHYAVVAAIDPECGYVVLASGNPYLERISLSLFRRMWDRAGNWALLVIDPAAGRLPAAAAADRWVKAVYGLERAQQHEAARDGYAEALKRWPEHPGALMGKANALYALGEVEAAADILESAASLHPASAPILNNLAHVRLAMGNLSEALEAADRAVAIGGAHADAYRHTRKKIREALIE